MDVKLKIVNAYKQVVLFAFKKEFADASRRYRYNDVNFFDHRSHCRDQVGTFALRTAN